MHVIDGASDEGDLTGYYSGCGTNHYALNYLVHAAFSWELCRKVQNSERGETTFGLSVPPIQIRHSFGESRRVSPLQVPQSFDLCLWN